MLCGKHIRPAIRRRTGLSRFQGISCGLRAKGRYTGDQSRLEPVWKTIFTWFGCPRQTVENQLLEITDVASAFVAVPEDDEQPDTIRILDAPFTQQDELLSCEFVEDEYDTAALTIASPTAQTVQQARRVLGLVTQCNEAAKTSILGAEIFKPTTHLMMVFVDLPWFSVTDRFRFGDFVDCLYFTFYEGAGTDKLRFLDKHGGPLTNADCDLIWCIKHLRNKWSRHDPDRGKEKEIQKSWAELAA